MRSSAGVASTSFRCRCSRSRLSASSNGSVAVNNADRRRVQRQKKQLSLGGRRQFLRRCASKEKDDDDEEATRRRKYRLNEPDVLIVQSKNKKIMFSTQREINVKEVSLLCDKVGWPKRPEEKLKIALENSFLVSQMYICSNDTNGLKKDKDERLIATCRATSDHAFNACLWDIIVDPEYQGQGLGKAIVSHSIRALLARDVANVTLFADADVVEFYERLGFVTDADGVKGMFLYPNGDGE